eukprot:761082-Hanusia_phi.AAC.2
MFGKQQHHLVPPPPPGPSLGVQHAVSLPLLGFRIHHLALDEAHQISRRPVVRLHLEAHGQRDQRALPVPAAAILSSQVQPQGPGKLLTESEGRGGRDDTEERFLGLQCGQVDVVRERAVLAVEEGSVEGVQGDGRVASLHRNPVDHPAELLYARRKELEHVPRQQDTDPVLLRRCFQPGGDVDVRAEVGDVDLVLRSDGALDRPAAVELSSGGRGDNKRTRNAGRSPGGAGSRESSAVPPPCSIAEPRPPPLGCRALPWASRPAARQASVVEGRSKGSTGGAGWEEREQEQRGEEAVRGRESTKGERRNDQEGVPDVLVRSPVAPAHAVVHDLPHPVDHLHDIRLQHFRQVCEVADVAEAEESMHNHSRAVCVQCDDAVPQAARDHARSCLPEAQLKELGKAEQPLLDFAERVDDLEEDVGGDGPGGPEEDEGDEERRQDSEVDVIHRELLLVERDNETFSDVQLPRIPTELARLASCLLHQRHTSHLQEDDWRPHFPVLPEERLQHRLKALSVRILRCQMDKRVGEDRRVGVDV